jgi:hypothetical protein
MNSLIRRTSSQWLILLLGVVCGETLVGCGGGTTANPTAGPTPADLAIPAMDARQGRYVGAVNIGGIDYYGDALITADGLLRMYVGGPYASDGTVQSSIPATSAQLVGTMAPTTDPDGADVVFGQGCSAPTDPLHVCEATSHAKHSLEIVAGNLQGQIVETVEATNVWSVNLSPWANYYDRPATQSALAGTYQEQLAEFAQAGDTILSVDASGDISFQSPDSGCTGRGTLTPHLKGVVNVYDVLLTISNCQPPYSQLNTDYEGLATTSPSAAWDYDALLRMWLLQTNPDIWDGQSPPALTMSARLLY